MRHIDHLIIHCAATPPNMDIDAAEIDRWHRAKGWWGNGYHAVIKRDGTLETFETGHRCRPFDRAGAHVGDCGEGWNKRSIGVCLIGGVDSKGNPEDNFTSEQYATLASFVMETVHKYPSIIRVMGHGTLAREQKAPPKACPSFDVTKWLNEEFFFEPELTLKNVAKPA